MDLRHRRRKVSTKNTCGSAGIILTVARKLLRDVRIVSYSYNEMSQRQHLFVVLYNLWMGSIVLSLCNTCDVSRRSSLAVGWLSFLRGGGGSTTKRSALSDLHLWLHTLYSMVQRVHTTHGTHADTCTVTIDASNKRVSGVGLGE